jgi:hypothetical protein
VPEETLQNDATGEQLIINDIPNTTDTMGHSMLITRCRKDVNPKWLAQKQSWAIGWKAETKCIFIYPGAW